MSDRRKFLVQAPMLGAALGVAAAQQQTRSGPFRVGCLNVWSYSHLKDLWAPLINPRADQKETPFTGMRITHCWDIEPDRAREFAKIFRCEAVANHDDMLGKVDGIISGGYYEHGWSHILHQPYLEAGLPNLINRPFANSLAKAHRMIETARKHKATILVPSAYEYTEAITRAKAWATGKKILCYGATNSFDDYPTHGIHGVYMVCKAVAEAGSPVVSVSYQTKSWYSPPGLMTFEHQDQSGRNFFGSLHQVAGSWGTVQIHTAEEYGGKDFLIRSGVVDPFNKTEVWAPTIWAFQRMALYGDMPETFDQIDHKTRVFLAGWRSVLENGGKPVKLDQVPEEWEAPVELPNHPDHNTAALFRKRFGK